MVVVRPECKNWRNIIKKAEDFNQEKLGVFIAGSLPSLNEFESKLFV